jgi:hypothetical protein
LLKSNSSKLREQRSRAAEHYKLKESAVYWPRVQFWNTRPRLSIQLFRLGENFSLTFLLLLWLGAKTFRLGTERLRIAGINQNKNKIRAVWQCMDVTTGSQAETTNISGDARSVS